MKDCGRYYHSRGRAGVNPARLAKWACSLPHITTKHMAETKFQTRINEFITKEEKERIFRMSRTSSRGHLKRVYYKQAVVYGDYMDLYTYHELKMIYNGKNNSGIKGKQGSKRNDSVQRARNSLYRLVKANVYQHGKFRPIFGTYTFSECVRELDTANIQLQRYIRKLRRYLGKPVLYVAVPEQHESKAWHFHLVFFNVPKLDFETNDKLWGQGKTAVNMKFVKGVNGVRDVAGYISKYLSKDFLVQRGINKKMFYASRGLKRPIVIYANDTIDDILKNARIKVLNEYEGKTFVQTQYKLV